MRQLLYSKTIAEFLRLMRGHASAILTDAGFTCKRSRIHYNGYSYPLQLVAFYDPVKLGYFDKSRFEIGLNKQLIFSNEALPVLKHELAHFIAFIKHGTLDHGATFKKTCADLGLDKEMARAAITLKQQAKVQKLFAMAERGTLHESQVALLKAQQLIKQYNLEHRPMDDEELILSRTLSAAKITPKLQTISEILSTFGVSPVFSKSREGTVLEIFGPPVNVEIAEYAAAFLDRELDRLCKESAHELKGNLGRNSFLRGIATGFVEMASKERSLIPAPPITDFYSSISRTERTHKECSSARSLGKKVGKKLKITEGLSSRLRLLIEAKTNYKK